MDKNNLIKLISLGSGVKRNKCESIFDIILKSIAGDLKEKKNISIEGFGDFNIIRSGAKVLIKGDRKVIYPPANTVEFKINGENLNADFENLITKKKEITSLTAKEFYLTDTDSEAIVNIIFSTLKESFRKNKILHLQKFGEFKTFSNNKVDFRPSKKLLKKINYDFNDLEIAEAGLNEETLIEEQNEFEYTMSDEFRNSYKEICESGEAVIENKFETESILIKKKLISDELIKLHNEIVDNEKTIKE